MTDLIFAATCDLAGKVRGKAFPADQLSKRLSRGVGWVPTNAQITCFDSIAESPFGALGDLLLIPDEAAGVSAQIGETIQRYMLGDIVTLDGDPWEFCTRSILRCALERLKAIAGVDLLSAFEQEFQIRDARCETGTAFGLAAFEAKRVLCEALVSHIADAGLTPDSVLKEYGPNQFEVVIAPEQGVRAADGAVIVRELTRSTARHFGTPVTFAPILDPASVGNGVHIHMSFLDQAGASVTYDPEGPCGMSALTGSFVAGVLKYLDSILALTAPSVVSYLRLTPHRWSAAYNNLGFCDREASVRICPVTAKDTTRVADQFNVEFRAADAAACPHLALAAIVHAGCQGIEEALCAPKPTQEDLSLLTRQQLDARGFVRLPETLEAALERFVANDIVTGWFPDSFASVYAAHKAAEIACLSDMDMTERCTAYAETY